MEKPPLALQGAVVTRGSVHPTYPPEQPVSLALRPGGDVWPPAASSLGPGFSLSPRCRGSLWSVIKVRPVGLPSVQFLLFPL